MNFFTIPGYSRLGNPRPDSRRSFDNSTLYKIMRIGISTVIISICTVQLLFATKVIGQNIEEVEISIELKKEPLLKTFKKIESKSPFHFMYNNEDVKAISLHEIPASKKSVAEILDLLLMNTPLSYKQVDHRILIVNKNVVQQNHKANIFEVLSSEKQQLIIKGRVTDLKGDPLPGVNIKVKGGTTGATTDTDGRYGLTLPESNSVLVYTFMGFTTQEIPVDGRSTIDIQLVEESNALNEVVVTALGITTSDSALASPTITTFKMLLGPTGLVCGT